jgi:hypothetical protein
MKLTIEETTHGHAVVLRLPDRKLRIAVAQELTTFVEGEMGRLPVIEHKIPAGFPTTPEAALACLADIVMEAVEKEGGENLDV